MNLQELSKLVQVTVHLKDVINSAGYTKFKPETITALKRRLSEFDELFISEMLNYDNRNSAKMIHDAVREAREKMELDQKYAGPSSLEKLQELAKEATPKEDKKPFVRRNAKPVMEETSKEDLQETKPQAVEPAVTAEKEVKEQPKKVFAPSSNQPYMEDQSLAALLAAEKQKVAAKKRK